MRHIADTRCARIEFTQRVEMVCTQYPLRRLRFALPEIGPTLSLISSRSSSPQLAELAPHDREQPVLSDGAHATVEAVAPCGP